MAHILGEAHRSNMHLATLSHAQSPHLQRYQGPIWPFSHCDVTLMRLIFRRASSQLPGNKPQSYPEGCWSCTDANFWDDKLIYNILHHHTDFFRLQLDQAAVIYPPPQNQWNGMRKSMAETMVYPNRPGFSQIFASIPGQSMVGSTSPTFHSIHVDHVDHLISTSP